MRSILASTLVAFSIAAAACSGELEPGKSGEEGDPPSDIPQRLRVTGDGDDVRLHDGPGGSFNTIMRIPVGCLVDPTGPPDVGWLPIRWRAEEGWIYGANVEHAPSDAADCP